ncbi:MAG: M48 family metallopeptidase [Spirochaetales bacterium]|nr:M48 family metallopeptidase [Spirochaetales bacterium]
MKNRRGWIGDILILSATIITIAVVSYGVAVLIENGKSDRDELSEKIDKSFTKAVELSIRNSNEIIDDPVINDLIKVLQERLKKGLILLSEENSKTPNITILVVDSSTINAVAFPGNLIVIYSGLIKKLDNAEELSGILAHELGHCVYHDSRNALIREVGLSIFLSGGAGELSEEIIRGAINMKYGRKAEKRADMFAVELLAASDIDPLYYGKALEKISNISSEKTPEWLNYTDVHPPIENRISTAYERSEQINKTGYKDLNVDWQTVLDNLPKLFQ